MNRWKVACINWSHNDAPKAIAYMLTRAGWARGEKYFPTHAEAITYAHQQATRAIAARNQLPPRKGQP